MASKENQAATAIAVQEESPFQQLLKTPMYINNVDLDPTKSGIQSYAEIEGILYFHNGKSAGQQYMTEIDGKTSVTREGREFANVLFEPIKLAHDAYIAEMLADKTHRTAAFDEAIPVMKKMIRKNYDMAA